MNPDLRTLDELASALLPIACDAVTNLAEAGQLLDVDVN